MINLTELHELLPELIDDGLSEVEGAADADLARACEGLCVLYRARAISALLLQLDVDQFHHMLTRSGLTRIHALGKMPATVKSESRFAKLTRSQAFFDSLAANRYDLAKQIGSRGVQTWMERCEYEDDYCYALFLHKLAEGADKKTLEDVLARFKTALDALPSPGFDLCKSLLARDDDGFASAFAGKLKQWEEELTFQEKSISRDDFAFAANRYVYVEGLALLRLAEGLGIATEEQYQYCPRESRMAMEGAFPDDGYPK